MITVKRIRNGSARGAWGSIHEGETKTIPRSVYDRYPEHYEEVGSEGKRKAPLGGTSKPSKPNASKTTTRVDGEVHEVDGVPSPASDGTSA